MAHLEALYRECELRDPASSIRLLILHPASHGNAALRAGLVQRGKKILPCLYDEEEWLGPWILTDESGEQLDFDPKSGSNTWQYEDGKPGWSEASRYEALSYCWGNAADSVRVTINEIPVLIRRNLASALSQLRFKDRPRLLWVDSLCINQQDDIEKSEQVHIMPLIFANADRTLIWVGDDPSGCHGEVLGLISHAARSITKERPSADTLAIRPQLKLVGPRAGGSGRPKARSLTSRRSFELRQCIADFYSSKRRPATPGKRVNKKTLHAFLNRSWFGRRWVVQEVIIASRATLHCGRASVDWEDVKTFIGAVSDWPKETRALRAMKFGRRYGPRRRYGAKRYEIPRNIFQALHMYDGFECTDDRDLVASMTQLTGSAEPWARYRVEYDLSTEENYIAFALRMVQLGYVETVMQSAAFRAAGTAQTQLPSWVPDWRLPVNSQASGFLTSGSSDVAALQKTTYTQDSEESDRDAAIQSTGSRAMVVGNSLKIHALTSWEIKNARIGREEHFLDLTLRVGCCEDYITHGGPASNPTLRATAIVREQVQQGDIVCSLAFTETRKSVSAATTYGYILRPQPDAVFKFVGALGPLDIVVASVSDYMRQFMHSWNCGHDRTHAFEEYTVI